MKLQTRLKLKPQDYNLIDYNSAIMAIGSCFVENMGAKLEYYRFKQLFNPFGILFSPMAIENVLKRVVDEEEYKAEDLHYVNGIWSCEDAHSRLNSISKEELLQNLNTAIRTSKQFLLKSTHLIITLGTSWVYRDKIKDKIIANCHKRPQSEFTKEILDIETIMGSLHKTLNYVRAINNKMTVIFTVSPVRHIKDGIVENTRSKAHLLSAIHRIVDADSKSYYFPSYEIMMDELRDYRFYERDMIHPNQLSIDYIWEQFKGTWIASDAYDVMNKVNKIQTALLHRPFNQDSTAYKNFIANITDQKQQLIDKFPHMRF